MVYMQESIALKSTTNIFNHLPLQCRIDFPLKLFELYHLTAIVEQVLYLNVMLRRNLVTKLAMNAISLHDCSSFTSSCIVALKWCVQVYTDPEPNVLFGRPTKKRML